MKTNTDRNAFGNPAARRAEPVSRARSLRSFGPGWRGLVLLLLFLYPALPDPAMARLSCDDQANCQATLDRFSAQAGAPSFRGSRATTTDGFINLGVLESGRRHLTMVRSGDVLNPVEFDVCGPLPLVDTFIRELGYRSKDMKKFDIHDIVVAIKEYFPCD